MDMFLDIFKQLSANESLWYQFGIVIVMFFVTKFLFLNHLQEVIQKREEKTVDLDGDAEKQFEEINKIQTEYKATIQKANKEIKEKIDTEKMSIVKTHEANYRNQEKEINEFIDNSRKEVEVEIANKKNEILGQADQLSSNLVEKITKGL